MTIFEKVMTSREIVENENFEQTQWLVDDLIPSGQAGLIVAPPKAMKSSLSMDIAQAVSSGGKVMNHQARQANVLIIQNENNVLTERQRLMNGKRENNDNLFFLHGGVFKLDNIEHMRDLTRYIQENDIKLVVIDPLKDTLSSDEILNSMQEMNRVLMQLTKMKLFLNDVSFILVAHARKNVTEQSLGEKDFRVVPEHVLGSTAIPSWYEFCFTMSPKRGKNSNYSIIRLTARNFAYNKEIACGYIGDQFSYILPESEKEKHREEVEEEVKEELVNDLENIKDTEKAVEFMEALKEQGKVTEI